MEQGLWGSFEVFFDTFIVCSITALSVILILSGQYFKLLGDYKARYLDEGGEKEAVIFYEDAEQTAGV